MKYAAEPGTQVNPQTDAIQDFQMNPHASPWEHNPQPDFSLMKDKSAVSASDVEYLQSMKKLATATLLPRTELQSFDGNPLNYHLFVRSFESNVEMGTDDYGKRLQLLIQFCSGKARNSIENCILLDPTDGYAKAKAILAERFGNSYVVANSLVKKVCDGSQIKPGNKEGLQEMADELESCEITLKATKRLTQLNNEDRLLKILERCPIYVKSRWQSRVQDIRLQQRDPTITDVRMMIRTVANEKNDPVYGSITDNPGRDTAVRSNFSRRYVTEPKKMPSRAANFSIGAQETSNYTLKCFFCEESHRLVNCEKFKLLNGEQQFKMIKAKSLCDNCLSHKHYSLGCKKNKECTVPGCEVRRKHLTAIHNAVKESERKRREQLSKENTNNDVQNQESSARSQFVGMAKHEESALDKNGLSIVPVKVKR